MKIKNKHLENEFNNKEIAQEANTLQKKSQSLKTKMYVEKKPKKKTTKTN